MPANLTRRGFLQAAAVGAAAGLAAGWGSGAATEWIATWDAEFGAVRLLSDGRRILAAEGNSGHPLAASFRGDALQAALARLEDPLRLAGPLGRRGRSLHPLSYSAAIDALSAILRSYRGDQIAFVLGEAPDHLHDLVQLLAAAIGGAMVLRFSPRSLLEARVTLQDAAQLLFGLPRLPVFDLGRARLIYSFGVTGAETWLGNWPDSEAQWVHFSPDPPAGLVRRVGTPERVRIQPGSEPRLAYAINNYLYRLRGGERQLLPGELLAVGDVCGLAPAELMRLAQRFNDCAAPLALPGMQALRQVDGLEAAKAILGLNAVTDSRGRSGVTLPLEAPIFPQVATRTATFAEAATLVERVHARQVKVLLVHGVDLVAALPAGLDVERALEKLESLVSFNSLLDETAALASLLLPDRLPLEAWGYQRAFPSADRPLAAAIRPVFEPRREAFATADLLLQSAQAAGLGLPYAGELDFIRRALAQLPLEGIGPKSNAPAGLAPGLSPQAWGHWLDRGGWWTNTPLRLSPVCLMSAHDLLRLGGELTTVVDPVERRGETGLNASGDLAGWG